MSQKRYFNWKDDDKTDWLNRQYMGILAQGLYQGFDPSMASLTLTLSQANGVVETLLDGSNSNPKGIVRTKQGVVVTEEASIDLPVEENDVNLDRIDTVVLEHEYIAVDGGSPAVYKVLKGIPANNPIAPAANTYQVVLGHLLVPANATDLSEAVYTKASVPSFADDSTIVHTDKKQHITEKKRFDLLVHSIEQIAVISGTSLVFPKEVNNYVTELNAAPAFVDISTFTGAPTDDGTWFKILVGRNIRVVQGGNLEIPSPIQSDMYIQAGTMLSVLRLNGLYWIYRGNEALLSRPNKFRRTVSLAKGTVTQALTGEIDFNLGGSGNYYSLSLAEGASLKSLSSNHPNEPLSIAYGGTPIWLKLDGADNLIRVHHNGAGLKPIKTPTGNDLFVPKGSLLCLMEDEEEWLIVSITSTNTYWQNEAWKYLGEAGTMDNGEAIPAKLRADQPLGIAQRLRKLSDGRVEFEGSFKTGEITTASPQFAICTLPVGYRPDAIIFVNQTIQSGSTFSLAEIAVGADGVMTGTLLDTGITDPTDYFLYVRLVVN